MSTAVVPTNVTLPAISPTVITTDNTNNPWNDNHYNLGKYGYNQYGQYHNRTCAACGSSIGPYQTHICYPRWPQNEFHTHIHSANTDPELKEILGRIADALERLAPLQIEDAPTDNVHEKVCGSDDEGGTDQAVESRRTGTTTDWNDLNRIVRKLELIASE